MLIAIVLVLLGFMQAGEQAVCRTEASAHIDARCGAQVKPWGAKND